MINVGGKQAIKFQKQQDYDYVFSNIQKFTFEERRPKEQIQTTMIITLGLEHGRKAISLLPWAFTTLLMSVYFSCKVKKFRFSLKM